ncbi:MAG: hypothetical protein U9Q71_10940, partial [Pseudomonadota bacterium]|nr:hypothetical protein [Pseudomonadota bacterium]
GLSYLPYFFILWHRGGFLYYMLPAVAPMTLIVVRALSTIATEKRGLVVGLFAGVVAVTLALFLPLVMGFPMSSGYQANVARLLYS